MRIVDLGSTFRGRASGRFVRGSGGHAICMLVVLLALGACGLGVDAEQARICRLALPALNPEGARVTILGIGPGPLSRSIRIDYRAERADRRTMVRFAICRFAAEGLAGSKAELVGLATEEGPLSDAAFYFLRRFFIETPEALALDPGRGDRTADVIEVPRGVAYALQQTVAGLPKIAIYGLLASAFALVYGLVGRINLAFGELAALGGAATVSGIALALSSGITTPVAGLSFGILLATSAAALHGAVGGHYAIARITSASTQPALIATVGLSIALMEYLRLTQSATTIWIPPIWTHNLTLVRSGDFVVNLTPMSLATSCIGLGAGGGLVALVGRSRFGRAWRAYADDAKAAALFGIDGDRLLLQSFALASAMAGLAGFLVVAQFGGLGFAGGFVLGLKALVAAVIGGIGSVPGALLGGFAIGAFEIAWSAMMPIEARDIALYAALILVLMFRPGGLFGWAEGTPRQV